MAINAPPETTPRMPPPSTTSPSFVLSPRSSLPSFRRPRRRLISSRTGWSGLGCVLEVPGVVEEAILLAKCLPGLSLLPLDGGFLIVLSPFHLREEASLHHEFLQRLERWLDLIVTHFDCHGFNSLLDASAFGGAKLTWPRRGGSREVKVPDGRICRWM